MKSVNKTISKRPVPRDYLELVARFPLRRIRSESEYRQALNLVDELSARGDARLAEGEIDYFEALARFISDYELAHFLSEIGHATPLEVLRHLMDAHEMSSAGLGDVLGSRPAASMILKGQREMSKANIRAAAAHFGVSAAVFI